LNRINDRLDSMHRTAMQFGGGLLVVLIGYLIQL